MSVSKDDSETRSSIAAVSLIPPTNATVSDEVDPLRAFQDLHNEYSPTLPLTFDSNSSPQKLKAKPQHGYKYQYSTTHQPHSALVIHYPTEQNKHKSPKVSVPPFSTPFRSGEDSQSSQTYSPSNTSASLISTSPTFSPSTSFTSTASSRISNASFRFQAETGTENSHAFPVSQSALLSSSSRSDKMLDKPTSWTEKRSKTVAYVRDEGPISSSLATQSTSFSQLSSRSSSYQKNESGNYPSKVSSSSQPLCASPFDFSSGSGNGTGVGLGTGSLVRPKSPVWQTCELHVYKAKELNVGETIFQAEQMAHRLKEDMRLEALAREEEEKRVVYEISETNSTSSSPNAVSSIGSFNEKSEIKKRSSIMSPQKNPSSFDRENLKPRGSDEPIGDSVNDTEETISKYDDTLRIKPILPPKLNSTCRQNSGKAFGGDIEPGSDISNDLDHGSVYPLTLVSTQAFPNEKHGKRENERPKNTTRSSTVSSSASGSGSGSGSFSRHLSGEDDESFFQNPSRFFKSFFSVEKEKPSSNSIPTSLPTVTKTTWGENTSSSFASPSLAISSSFAHHSHGHDESCPTLEGSDKDKKSFKSSFFKLLNPLASGPTVHVLFKDGNDRLPLISAPTTATTMTVKTPRNGGSVGTTTFLSPIYVSSSPSTFLSPAPSETTHSSTGLPLHPHPHAHVHVHDSLVQDVVLHLAGLIDNTSKYVKSSHYHSSNRQSSNKNDASESSESSLSSTYPSGIEIPTASFSPSISPSLSPSISPSLSPSLPSSSFSLASPVKITQLYRDSLEILLSAISALTSRVHCGYQSIESSIAVVELHAIALYQSYKAYEGVSERLQTIITQRLEPADRLVSFDMRYYSSLHAIRGQVALEQYMETKTHTQSLYSLRQQYMGLTTKVQNAFKDASNVYGPAVRTWDEKILETAVQGILTITQDTARWLELYELTRVRIVGLVFHSLTEMERKGALSLHTSLREESEKIFPPSKDSPSTSRVDGEETTIKNETNNHNSRRKGGVSRRGKKDKKAKSQNTDQDQDDGKSCVDREDLKDASVSSSASTDVDGHLSADCTAMHSSEDSTRDKSNSISTPISASASQRSSRSQSPSSSVSHSPSRSQSHIHSEDSTLADVKHFLRPIYKAIAHISLLQSLRKEEISMESLSMGTVESPKRDLESRLGTSGSRDRNSRSFSSHSIHEDAGEVVLYTDAIVATAIPHTPTSARLEKKEMEISKPMPMVSSVNNFPSSATFSEFEWSAENTLADAVFSTADTYEKDRMTLASDDTEGQNSIFNGAEEYEALADERSSQNLSASTEEEEGDDETAGGFVPVRSEAISLSASASVSASPYSASVSTKPKLGQKLAQSLRNSRKRASIFSFSTPKEAKESKSTVSFSSFSSASAAKSRENPRDTGFANTAVSKKANSPDGFSSRHTHARSRGSIFSLLRTASPASTRSHASLTNAEPPSQRYSDDVVEKAERLYAVENKTLFSPRTNAPISLTSHYEYDYGFAGNVEDHDFISHYEESGMKTNPGARSGTTSFGGDEQQQQRRMLAAPPISESASFGIVAATTALNSSEPNENNLRRSHSVGYNDHGFDVVARNEKKDNGKEQAVERDERYTLPAVEVEVGVDGQSYSNVSNKPHLRGLFNALFSEEERDDDSCPEDDVFMPQTDHRKGTKTEVMNESGTVNVKTDILKTSASEFSKNFQAKGIDEADENINFIGAARSIDAYLSRRFAHETQDQSQSPPRPQSLSNNHAHRDSLPKQADQANPSLHLRPRSRAHCLFKSPHFICETCQCGIFLTSDFSLLLPEISSVTSNSSNHPITSYTPSSDISADLVDGNSNLCNSNFSGDFSSETCFKIPIKHAAEISSNSSLFSEVSSKNTPSLRAAKDKPESTLAFTLTPKLVSESKSEEKHMFSKSSKFLAEKVVEAGKTSSAFARSSLLSTLHETCLGARAQTAFIWLKKERKRETKRRENFAIFQAKIDSLKAKLNASSTKIREVAKILSLSPRHLRSSSSSFAQASSYAHHVSHTQHRSFAASFSERSGAPRMPAASTVFDSGLNIPSTSAGPSYSSLLNVNNPASPRLTRSLMQQLDTLKREGAKILRQIELLREKQEQLYHEARLDGLERKAVVESIYRLQPKLLTPKLLARVFRALIVFSPAMVPQALLQLTSVEPGACEEVSQETIPTLSRCLPWETRRWVEYILHSFVGAQFTCYCGSYPSSRASFSSSVCAFEVTSSTSSPPSLISAPALDAEFYLSAKADSSLNTVSCSTCGLRHLPVTSYHANYELFSPTSSPVEAIEGNGEKTDTSHSAKVLGRSCRLSRDFLSYRIDQLISLVMHVLLDVCALKIHPHTGLYYTPSVLHRSAVSAFSHPSHIVRTERLNVFSIFSTIFASHVGRAAFARALHLIRQHTHISGNSSSLTQTQGRSSYVSTPASSTNYNSTRDSSDPTLPAINAFFLLPSAFVIFCQVTSIFLDYSLKALRSSSSSFTSQSIGEENNGKQGNCVVTDEDIIKPIELVMIMTQTFWTYLSGSLTGFDAIRSLDSLPDLMESKKNASNVREDEREQTKELNVDLVNTMFPPIFICPSFHEDYPSPAGTNRSLATVNNSLHSSLTEKKSTDSFFLRPETSLSSSAENSTSYKAVVDVILADTHIDFENTSPNTMESQASYPLPSVNFPSETKRKAPEGNENSFDCGPNSRTLLVQQSDRVRLHPIWKQAMEFWSHSLHSSIFASSENASEDGLNSELLKEWKAILDTTFVSIAATGYFPDQMEKHRNQPLKSRMANSGFESPRSSSNAGELEENAIQSSIPLQTSEDVVESPPEHIILKMITAMNNLYQFDVGTDDIVTFLVEHMEKYRISHEYSSFIAEFVPFLTQEEINFALKSESKDA